MIHSNLPRHLSRNALPQWRRQDDNFGGHFPRGYVSLPECMFTVYSSKVASTM